MICKFACVKSAITDGNIKNIKGTNIAYVKPHIININNIDYLMLDECDDIFINGYDEKEDLGLFMGVGGKQYEIQV